MSLIGNSSNVISRADKHTHNPNSHWSVFLFFSLSLYISASLSSVSSFTKLYHMYLIFSLQFTINMSFVLCCLCCFIYFYVGYHCYSDITCYFGFLIDRRLWEWWRSEQHAPARSRTPQRSRRSRHGIVRTHRRGRIQGDGRAAPHRSLRRPRRRRPGHFTGTRFVFGAGRPVAGHLTTSPQGKTSKRETESIE